MKKFVFGTILSSLMAFSGCQVVGIESIDDNTSAGGKTVTITANIAGSTDTKVSLTPDTDPEGHPIVKVDWKESGETFEVYGSSSTSSTFTQIAGTNQFEGTLPESTNGEYEVVYGDINSLDEQNGELGQSTANNSPVLMYAMFNSSSSSITFEHETAILKPTFKVDGDNINKTITQILMGNIAKSNSGNGYYVDEITITPADLDNIYIHLLVFPQVYIADHEFTFTVTAGGKNYTGSLTIPTDKSIEAGNLYTATVNLTQKESQPSEVILSQSGAANCYIISQAGSYKFSTVKGNSSTSVGAVNYAEVLWESFGTATVPTVGDLVNNVSYSDGYISFTATEAEGNAVIAAKSDNGTPDDTSDDVILWSWHIWLTDQPQVQEYFNNAGTMMDRNLGATSATPGDVGALGLLYQWGRKDPFLGSSSIDFKSIEICRSTIEWPSSVESTSSTGTIEYSIANPITFIRQNEMNMDWYYTGDGTNDNSRWVVSEKSIYDPCPFGWRVPDNGQELVWSKALGEFDIYNDFTFDRSDRGVDFVEKLGASPSIWYPVPGAINFADGTIQLSGLNGYYWSAHTSENKVKYLSVNINSCYVMISESDFPRSNGVSVRCVKENFQSSGDQPLASSASDLGTDGTANSYIVSKSGTYKFKPVKGNSSTSVGSVSSVEVLWESFGTDVTPNVGDLIKTVNYDAGYVVFATPSSFTRGNAVIAAKNSSGEILWSWHIWLTDQPQGQVYYNKAGTMMDRNLGATSATPGDVGALGLLYQWGRKDPFLGSSSISSKIEAKSTGTWPPAVKSNSSNGTIDYATANPTTFITYNTTNNDWYYPGSSSTDNTRWTESSKSIYDPCPAGWRVPDGGSNGVWARALGSLSSFNDSSLWDSTNKGMNFYGKFGSDQTIWYPASGYRAGNDGSLTPVGNGGNYWSASPSSSNSYNAYYLGFNFIGNVNPSNSFDRAYGMSVRCLQE